MRLALRSSMVPWMFDAFAGGVERALREALGAGFDAAPRFGRSAFGGSAGGLGEPEPSWDKGI